LKPFTDKAFENRFESRPGHTLFLDFSEPALAAGFFVFENVLRSTSNFIAFITIVFGFESSPGYGAEHFSPKSKIFHFRGHNVMLDKTWRIYMKPKTKQLKRQVRRNIDRFPDDFMFELTQEEFENLRSQIGASRWGGYGMHRWHLPSKELRCYRAC
jgi:ORF6N domain